MISALLGCVVGLTPVQERWGLWTLGAGQTRARPFSSLRGMVADAVVVEDRVLAWVQGEGLWAIEERTGRARRMAKVPGVLRDGDDGQYVVANLLPLGRTALVGTDCAGVWWIPEKGLTASRITGLPGPDMSEITAIRAGNRTLIGSRNGGLFAVSDGSLRAKRIGGLPKGASVVCLTRAGAHTWVGTQASGVWRLRDGENRALLVTGFSDGLTSLTSFGREVLATTADSGAWRIAEGGLTARPVAGPEGPTEWVSGTGPKGRALLKASDGLWSLPLGSGTATHLKDSEKIGDRTVLADGNRVWAWNSVDLIVYDSSRGASQVVSGLPAEVTHVYPRPTDVLVGTYLSGLWSVDRRSLKVRRIEGPSRGSLISRVVTLGSRTLIPTGQGMSH